MAINRFRNPKVALSHSYLNRKIVLLDSNFLIRLLQAPLRTPLEDVCLEKFEMVVPEVVLQELKILAETGGRRPALLALRYAKKLPTILISKRGSVDDSIVEYAITHKTVVATLDNKLKQRLRRNRVPVLSIRSEKPFLEGLIDS